MQATHNTKAWLLLIGAVLAEIIAVTVMKIAAQTGSFSATLIMYAMTALSFTILAWVVKTLPVATAYAIWETLGLIIVTAIGYQYFGESLGTTKIIGITILLLGVVFVTLGPKEQRH